MLEFFGDRPEAVQTILMEAFQAIPQAAEAPKTPRAMLKKIGLPRLGKALDQL